MINFDEEVKKFKPVLELDQVEDAIYSNDMKDMADVMLEILQTKNSKNINQASQNE